MASFSNGRVTLYRLSTVWENEMLKDNNYNLMQDITTISQSLHRYDTYIKDAAHCNECQGVWRKLKSEREKELAMLLEELNKHIKKGEISP